MDFHMWIIQNEPNKEIYARGLQLIRGSKNYLTVAIFNSDDFVTDYSFSITISAGSGVIQLSAVMTTLVIFVCLIALFQTFVIVAGCQIVTEAKDTLKGSHKDSLLNDMEINNDK